MGARERNRPLHVVTVAPVETPSPDTSTAAPGKTTWLLLPPQQEWPCHWQNLRVFVMTFSVVFHTSYVPYYLAFLHGPVIPSRTPLVPILMPLFWLVDIGVTMRTAYHSTSGHLEECPWMILWHNLKEWYLWADLVSVVPLFALPFACLFGPLTSSTSLVLLLGLFKVPALLCYYFKRTSNGGTQLVFSLLVFCWVLHLVACLWAGVSDRCEMGGTTGKWECYTLAVYDSALLLYGEDISPDNNRERAACILSFVIGMVTVSVVGTSIIFNLRVPFERHIEYQRVMLNLTHMFKYQVELKPDLQAKIIEYSNYQMRTYHTTDVNRDRAKCLRQLNPLQQKEVLGKWHKKLTDACWMFLPLPPAGGEKIKMSGGFKLHILKCLQFQLYHVGDVVMERGDTCRDMFFIQSGQAKLFWKGTEAPDRNNDASGVTFTDGDCFGHVSAVLGVTRSAWVVADSRYLDLWALPWHHLEEISRIHKRDWNILTRHVKTFLSASDDILHDNEGAPPQLSMETSKRLMKALSRSRSRSNSSPCSHTPSTASTGSKARRHTVATLASPRDVQLELGNFLGS